MGIIKKLATKFYGTRMKLSKATGLGINIKSDDKKPFISFYSLRATANNGEEINFEKYRGKKILLVNLASQCGYTPQYEQLEELHQLHKNDITILGFPSNDFGGQEPGTDEEIADFCRINFGVTFQLFHKDHVVGENKQPVYEWLTDPQKNGWNNQESTWNFCKYLVNEEGGLTHFFSSSVSPVDEEIIGSILR